MQDLFAERLVNMHIHQGIARLDFARLESVNPDKNQVTYGPAMRLVMPLDAFMQAAEQMHRMREEILKQSQAPAPAQTTDKP